MRTAVVLYNLGGPCCLAGVKPFLLNLFSDPAILNLPSMIRLPLAKFIAARRTTKAMGIYKQMGGKSPILQQTYAQMHALQNLLGNAYCKVFVYMRYSYPMVEDVLQQVRLYNPDKVVLLPLYPQYSTTTTQSSIRQWEDAAAKHRLEVPTYIVPSYHKAEGFITAFAELLQSSLNKAKKMGDTITLFSAHGIPINRVQGGDPYQQHVEESAQAIAHKAGLKQDEYIICYQSKVGPLKWLAPSTEELIMHYSRQGKSIVVLPVAFVSEHSETLVELDIEYKELAFAHGAKGYHRVPTVGTHPDFIKCLGELVQGL